MGMDKSHDPNEDLYVRFDRDYLWYRVDLAFVILYGKSSKTKILMMIDETLMSGVWPWHGASFMGIARIYCVALNLLCNLI